MGHRLGAEDALTQESQSFLSALASSAVRVAKLENAAKQQHAHDIVRAASSSRSAHTQRTSSHVHANPALANRSLDELVDYIQGAPGTGTSRAARKRAARTKKN